ncbi:Ae [Aspergillus parasiticus SU-1]|uniref:Ae n=1 Tax=Aspergillus parasiticus (strain ATCC 56775 / NRRL 5862 / SRRC 143 / SU-1) TaxID=1403190 RepID=A0A0F0IDF6_ASPPU|nr:Ae [Aspergillus parasiticus SU-1]
MSKTAKPAVSATRLSLVQKLDMLPALVSIFSVGVVSLFSGLVPGMRRAPSLHLHVAYAMLRKATSRLSPLQLQLASPSTESIYLRYMRSARLTPQSVDLGTGAKGHWLGDKNAKKVLVWYHGGGFCLPANMGYFKFFEQLIQSAGDSGHDLAVFVLSYTLAPHMRYPGQLSQVVEALRYIVMQTHRSPLDVLVGGDSAGGNLAVGLLSHLSHPHPAIPALNLEEPLAGVILISPWTSLDANPVGLSKDTGDLITTQVAGPWSSAYLGGADKDYYSDASNAPSTWFENLQVKEILVLGGGNEIMRPMIEAFVQKVQVAFPSVELFIGELEAHVAPVFNLYVGSKMETQQGEKLKNWLKKML